MRLQSLHLQNFKRFTDLRIEGIPSTAKLVLLIGANGSGKSCVFDGLALLENSGGYSGITEAYHRKAAAGSILLSARTTGQVESTRIDDSPPSERLQLFGRSANRIAPELSAVSDAPSIIKKDSDAPKRFTREDRRIFADAAEFAARIDAALRAPVFEGKQVDTLEIFRTHIEPFNASLRRIFGDDPATTIQLKSYDFPDPAKPVQLWFQKGSSRIPFDLLSHGEKQIVILLLGFVVRRDRHSEAIYFIDEMDLHLNTALQKAVLREIVEQWVPEEGQLWTATHALGFIEYANESDAAVTIDFDALDYDEPQVLTPLPKDRLEVFEIAVPKESLARLFADRQVVFCEGKDCELYNLACRDQRRIFVPSNNAQEVFGRVEAGQATWAVRDKDYLMPEEVATLRQKYPRYRILPFYSIENLLYHPENIASLDPPSFDAAEWARAIAAKRPVLRDVRHARERIRELHGLKRRDADPGPIYADYESDDFHRFYPYMRMKELPRNELERFGLTRADLAQAPWFVAQIDALLAP